LAKRFDLYSLRTTSWFDPVLTVGPPPRPLGACRHNLTAGAAPKACTSSQIRWHLLLDVRAAHRVTAAYLTSGPAMGEEEPESDKLSGLTAGSPLSKMPPRAQGREHALVGSIRGSTLNDLQSAPGPTLPGRAQGAPRATRLSGSGSRILCHPGVLLKNAKGCCCTGLILSHGLQLRAERNFI
jgi:hypothetical protein